MPHTLSVSWSLVVTSTTGIEAVVGSFEIARVAWKPLRFGITTSIRIRSGIVLFATSTPEAPSSAVTVSWPSFSTMRFIPKSWEGESSTIRMRAMGVSTKLADCMPGERQIHNRSSNSDQRASEGASGQHSRENPRQLRQTELARADRLQVRRLPFAAQAAPQLPPDADCGAGRGDAQHRNPPDDVRHDGAVHFVSASHAAAGDIAVG